MANERSGLQTEAVADQREEEIARLRSSLGNKEAFGDLYHRVKRARLQSLKTGNMALSRAIGTLSWEKGITTVGGVLRMPYSQLVEINGLAEKGLNALLGRLVEVGVRPKIEGP